MSSAVKLENPDASEMYPLITSITQNGYSRVSKSIRASNNLPMGACLDLFRTYTEFNLITHHLRDNIIEQANRILDTESSGLKLKIGDNDLSGERVTDANDRILDRVSVAIDTVTGTGGAPASGNSGDLHWKKEPVIETIETGSSLFIGARNIPRPQLAFKERVDNSERVWVPRIRDKPNSVRPLALTLLHDDNGEPIGYEHPYLVELELYEPPAWVVASEPAAVPPPALADTPLVFVDTERALDELVDHLASVREIAVDLEHHSYRTYQGITCLVQVSTATRDYIIDALALREHAHKLNQPFTDPKILKVFHGADNDVLWLQRDLGVYVVGMLDTHLAARALRRRGLALRHLLHDYCDVRANKQYQLADWRLRPLPEALVAYARTDTHYLLYIWRRLRDELLAESDGPALLRAVLERSRHLCQQTYNKERLGADDHLALYVRSHKNFNSAQLAALRLLYRWRDTNARELDESPAYLLPNHMLVSLAEYLPRELQGVHAICSPMPPFVKQNLVYIHRIILSCRELRVDPVPPPQRDVLDQNDLHDLRDLHDLHDLHDIHDKHEDNDRDLPAQLPLIASLPASPDVEVFSRDSSAVRKAYVSCAAAREFVPPHTRYQRYRALSQLEEMREFKEKEAKIAAIVGGNEAMRREVLVQLKGPGRPAPDPAPSPPSEPAPARRKRRSSVTQVETYAYTTDNYDRFHNDSQPPHKTSKNLNKKKKSRHIT